MKKKLKNKNADFEDPKNIAILDLIRDRGETDDKKKRIEIWPDSVLGGLAVLEAIDQERIINAMKDPLVDDPNIAGLEELVSIVADKLRANGFTDDPNNPSLEKIIRGH